MDKVERPVLERRRIGLELHPHQRGGKRAAELREVEVAFGEHPVLIGADLTVMHGERVGVVGLNGAGKSVMLKTLVGQIAANWWGGLDRAFDQDRIPGAGPGHARSGPDAAQTLRATFPGTEEQAVSRLMAFLFDYEQVRRPIRPLSGGERTRLQLLLLMLSGANLLVLDEPTNHLDIESIEALESSIEAFEGTAIFISHDRYFLDRMADRVVEVRDGEARSWLGGYSEWLARREIRVPDACRAGVASAHDASRPRRAVPPPSRHRPRRPSPTTSRYGDRYDAAAPAPPARRRPDRGRA